MKAISSIILLLLLFLYSCEEKKDVENGPDSKIRYQYYNLEKVGWKSKKHTQKADDINYTATEVPLPYYILRSKGNNDLTKVDSIYKANNKERIIEFEFLQDEEKDLLGEEFSSLSYEDAVKYLSFDIVNDFFAVTSKNDTIKCSGSLYERHFKVTPSHKILLFFSGINPDDKIQLIYKDRIFNKGVLKFKFEEQITKIDL